MTRLISPEGVGVAQVSADEEIIERVNKLKDAIYASRRPSDLLEQLWKVASVNVKIDDLGSGIRNVLLQAGFLVTAKTKSGLRYVPNQSDVRSILNQHWFWIQERPVQDVAASADFPAAADG